MSECPQPPLIKLLVEHQDIEPKTGFMRICRTSADFLYPDGHRWGSAVPVDYLHRRGADAVCILPHYIDTETNRRIVYLRSSIRPAIYLHNYTQSFVPEKPGIGNLWEVAAGLVEASETGMEGFQAAAARECKEELGFACDSQFMNLLGKRTFTAVGMSPERIFFFETEVDPSKQGTPTEDGGPFEHGGVVIKVPLTTALEWVENGDLPDAKTEMCLYRLARKYGT